jgi:hypothetical protein
VTKASISSVVFFLAIGALLGGGGGCQAIVSGEVPGFTCRGTALAVCPSGMYCNGAGCVPCEHEDVCDGRDNDCNGLIDDGDGSDHDGDGITFCGRFSQEENRLVDLDCDDTDPDVHPGADEICNGIDDDCDGVVDNPESVCPEGQVCAPRGGGCIPQAEACSADNCAPPKQCDASTQQCINPTADLALGAPCGSDKECASGVCATTGMLAGAIKGPKGVCSKPCCTSNQCTLGFVCYAPGTGGRYCLHSDVVGRPATLGIVDVGSACSAAKDCRSGLCQDGRCLDTCCSDANCQNGTSCRVVDVAGKSFFGCAVPPGTSAGNVACASATECASNFCAAYAGQQRCVAPCCSSSDDCGKADGAPVLCVNARSGPSKPTFAACVGTLPKGANKSYGDTCTANDDCTSGLCDAVTARCSSVCCLDSDCPRDSPCRPAPSGVLRCVP